MIAKINNLLNNVSIRNYTKGKNKTHEVTLTEILNNNVRKTIRWCTPSINFNSPQIKNPYESDISLSYEFLGYPSEPSGIFEDAYKKAAKAYRADNTLFSVNGSTGSNFIVLRTLSKQIPNLRILAQRNIHKSVLNACQDYEINLLFLDANIDSSLQIFFPNHIKEIIEAVKKTKPHVLLITNPTYEGLVLNLKKLIQSVREINSEIIIFIEEAWGSHLIFSNHLPSSAMQSGADICIQSTHKQGGALQQAGMIHWKEGRINPDLLLQSYRNLSTSSPSYTLLASLDATRKQMEENGEKTIENSLKVAKELEKQLGMISGFHTLKLHDLKNRSSSIFDKDNTKVILDVSESGYTGFALARHLETSYNIVVEKCNATTILFLVPFQSKIEHVGITIQALKQIVKNNKTKEKVTFNHALEIPKNVPKILELGEVAKLMQDQVEAIPLKYSKGRISAENITPYPPGIPVTIQGEEFTAEAINFYENLRSYPNSYVLANDITLETVLVVK